MGADSHSTGFCFRRVGVHIFQELPTPTPNKGMQRIGHKSGLPLNSAFAIKNMALHNPLEVRYHICRVNRMKIEIEREEDGRWIAEIPDLPGVIVYGDSRNEAISKAEALALRVLADRLEHGEEIPELKEVFAVSA